MVYIFDEPSMGELHAHPRLSVEEGFGKPIQPTRGIWPPGEKGYYKSWDSPIGRGIDRTQAKLWRARNALAIRQLAGRLEAPAGTDFHQLLRLAHGLPLSAPPHEPRSERNEDHRWVAEFEWELEEHGLSYPANLTSILEAYGRRHGLVRKDLTPVEPNPPAQSELEANGDEEPPSWVTRVLGLWEGSR